MRAYALKLQTFTEQFSSSSPTFSVRSLHNPLLQQPCTCHTPYSSSSPHLARSPTTTPSPNSPPSPPPKQNHLPNRLARRPLHPPHRHLLTNHHHPPPPNPPGPQMDHRKRPHSHRLQHQLLPPPRRPTPRRRHVPFR